MRTGRTARRGAVVATVLALVLAPIAGAAPAAAHVRVEESTPAARQKVTKAVPQRFSMTFDGDVVEGSAVVRVDGPGGGVVSVGTPRLDGRTVVQRLADDLANGAYVARWTVTASDGHQVAGIVPFTIAVTAATRERAAAVSAENERRAQTAAAAEAERSNPALAAVLVAAVGFLLLTVLRRLRAAFR
jgi:copper resistance protein C